MKVLIVDDDRMVCECLIQLLPWEEMECGVPMVAYNGLEAWHCFEERPADFVICDLKMPVMGGIDLCRRIRERNNRTQIVFLSAYEDFETARIALKYGVTDYVLKPLNRAGLQNLEQLIRAEAERLESREWGISVMNGEYNGQIASAFNGENAEFFTEIFHRMEYVEEGEVQNLCLYLLHVLYDYLRLIRGGEERIRYDALYQKWCGELIKCEDSREKVRYISEKYREMSIQKGTDTEGERNAGRVRELAEENYSRKDCNVAWIAEQMHMSTSYVGRIFRKYNGVSLMEYIIECRMKEARRLLGEGVLSVNEIAQETGYADSNYFTKVFRNRMGMSPSDYRRNSGADRRKDG